MRILFIGHTRIGDAVLASGLLAHLVARHPEARLTLAIGPLPAPLFAAMPNLERLIALEKRRYNRHWLALWRTTAGRVWDLVVDLRDSAVSRLVRARRRHILGPAGAAEHMVVRLGRLLGLDPPPAPRLWLDPTARARAAALLPADGPILALGPTANWRAKAWPADRFAQLATRLAGPGGVLAGARIAVLGAAAERADARPLLEALEPARTIDLVGRTDLATAAACLARAALYVGNDSGLMHIAAAAGTPTLGLFGPSSEVVYAPWGANAAWVRTPRSARELQAEPDRCCLMHGLAVDTVARAAEALWLRCR